MTVSTPETRVLRLFSMVGLLLLVAALYTPYLDITMKCDEANTLYQYARDLPRALLSYATPNNHILHSVLVWLMTSLAGTSSVIARFPTFAAALLGVALAFRVGSRWGGTRAGLGAAVFLAANLGFAGYAVNARGYTLTIALTLVLIELVFFTAPSSRQRYMLIAVSAALILVLPSMGMLIAAMLIWLVWQRRSDALALLPPIIMGCVAASIVYVPSFLAGTLSDDFALFGETDPRVLLVQWGNLVFGTPVIGLLFAVCCLIGVGVLLTKPGYWLARQISVSVFGTTFLLAIVQFSITHKLFYERNYLFLLAPLCLLAGLGLSRLAGRATLPLVCGLLVFSIFPLQSLGEPTDVDRLLAHIAQNVAPPDAVLVAPCWNAPVLQALRHGGDEKLFWSEDQTYRQVFVVSRGQPLDEVLDIFDAGELVANCQRDETWLPFEVNHCSGR